MKLDLPRKNTPVVTSNSIPVIGVSMTNWAPVTGEMIVSQIRVGRSLLETIGAKELLSDTKPVVRELCKMAKAVIVPDELIVEPFSLTMRERATNYLLKRMPFELNDPEMLFYFGEAPINLPDLDDETSAVMTYNHPTIGDLFRMLGLVFAHCPNKRVLVPVDAVWYESVVDLLPTIRALGVELLPLMSARLRAMSDENPEEFKYGTAVPELDMRLSMYFHRRCLDFLAHGEIVLVPLTMSPKKHIFDNVAQFRGHEACSHFLRSIEMKNLSLPGASKTMLLPFAVLPPVNAAKYKMNVKKVFLINLASPLGREKLVKMAFDEDIDFDAEIRKSILSRLPPDFGIPNA
ncbi:hypothetical protein IJH27_01170 [Candidatus Saccharibacteria bacterium]|nr:hypothetical protein [Candidatus Saccharibacteria bacterium]